MKLLIKRKLIEIRYLSNSKRLNLTEFYKEFRTQIQIAYLYLNVKVEITILVQ